MLYQDLSNAQDENKIQLNLKFQNNLQNLLKKNYPINKSPLKITVNRFDAIYSLQTILDDLETSDIAENRHTNYTFIYKGISFDTNSAFSFAFFGIQNEDTITVVEENMPYTDILIHNRLSHPQFSNFYRKKGKLLEQGRLHDILLSRIEGTSACYRKNVYRFEQLAENEKNYNKNHSNTVVEDSQDAPSTHMLPQTWSEENTMFPKN